MLEVWNAASGQKITEFQDEEIAGASVKALKQRLAKELGISRFQLESRAPGRHLPTERRWNLALTSCTLCDPEFWTTWWAKSGDHGGMSGKWWHTAWEAPQPATKSEFSRCKSNHAPGMRQPPTEVSNVYFCYLKLGQKMTKVGLILEQRLYSWQLRKGTLKLSDFWWGPVPTKTKAGQTLEQHLFSFAAHNAHFEVARFLLGSGANKDQGPADTGATPLFATAQNGHFEVVRFLVGFDSSLSRQEKTSQPI